MEHKEKNDYLTEFLNDQNSGDFDNLLKEKLKGWKEPTESQILAEQKVLPTKGPKPPVESVVAGSSNTSNSNGTGEPEKSSQSSGAKPVDELIVEEAPTSAEVDEQRRLDEQHELKSDPDYTRLILEGSNKVQQHKIRGIKTGPWANQRAEAENIPSDEILKRLGLPNYGELWGNARKFFVRKCGADVQKVVDHLNKLEIAAFHQYLVREAGKEYFKELLKDLSEDERKKAEAYHSKIYRAKADRSKPTIDKPKREKSSGEAKPKELKESVRKGLDLMLGLGATYEMMVEKLKKAMPADIELQLDYLKKHFGKA